MATQTISIVFTDTTANLVDMLNNFTDAIGYVPTINGSANPETRLAFATRMEKQRMLQVAIDQKAGAAAEAARIGTAPYTIT